MRVMCHVLYVFWIQQQEQDPTNLYLSNLPVSMDEQELENLLKPFGQVVSTRILRDANGVSRGVGFARSVTFGYWFWVYSYESVSNIHYLCGCVVKCLIFLLYFKDGINREVWRRDLSLQWEVH